MEEKIVKKDEETASKEASETIKKEEDNAEKNEPSPVNSEEPKQDKQDSEGWERPAETVMEWVQTLGPFAKFADNFEFTDWAALKAFGVADLKELGIPSNAAVPLSKKISTLFTPARSGGSKRIAASSGGSNKKQKVDHDERGEGEETTDQNGDYEDMMINCQDCDKEFTFPAHEQEYYQRMGFGHRPLRCRACQAAKKASFFGVCYEFQEGKCMRGKRCRFSHDVGAGTGPRVCYQYQQGSCKFNDQCKFLHTAAGTPINGGRQVAGRFDAVSCRNFLAKGTCPYRNNCRFSHN